VDHAVTAVLLDWRSFDTLLEVMVLLVAVLVALALREAQPDSPDRMGLENPLLRGVMSWLLPLMLLVAGYLLWAGAHRPGGAFQAGAVLAAAGVLMVLTGRLRVVASLGLVERVGLVLGVAAFSALGLSMLWLEGRALALPGLWGIYVVEAALMLSIGLTLSLLFARGGGLRGGGPGEGARP
jgi:multisubunit Na+/H+ antiporter MnhB subunit